MNNTYHSSARFALGVALLAFSTAAWPLGLGDAAVESYLGQPLEVRIDLITRPSDDLESVTAKLASADDFKLIGASREDITVPLRFSVEDVEDDPHIVITSASLVTDPVLRLVVEVDWSSGRLLREYTLFLDPPTVAATAPAVDRRAEDTRQADRPRTRQPSEGEYGPVESGDTLWGIATEWSGGSGLDINKVMLAIQRENPRAFINDNINLLKQGVILRMPEVEEVNSMSAAEATSEVRNQTTQFRMRAPAAGPAPPLVSDAATPLAASEEEVGQPAPTPEDRLEIVPPSERVAADSAAGYSPDAAESAAAAELAALREELARKEEELISQQQQNEYLQQRIAELEGASTADMEGAVEDLSLAAMEDRLREERAEAAAAETEVAAEEPAPAVPAVRTSERAEGKPWYQSATIWVIIILLLAAAAVVWFLSRRRSADVYVSDIGREREEPTIVDEAPAAEEEATRVMEAEPEPEPEPQAPEPEEEKPPAAPKKPDEDAELLDEESADPEIKLDLARAYIAMGDKEAARAILEEVMAHGSEEQQADAKGMMEEL